MSSFGHYGPALLMLASVLITSCGSETGDRVLLRVSIEVPIDKASPLTISQDNTMVAISGYNEKIVLVDLVSGEVTATVDNAHARRALNAEFINRLYTSSWDSIKSWE